MTRLRWLHRVRLLAALLAVVAGLAYPLRELPGTLLAEAEAVRASPVHASPVHASPCGDMPPESPSGHTHGPHCLFCLTGAFSTAPEVALRVGLLSGKPAHQLFPAPRAAHTCPAHADARAPPLAPA